MEITQHLGTLMSDAPAASAASPGVSVGGVGVWSSDGWRWEGVKDTGGKVTCLHFAAPSVPTVCRSLSSPPPPTLQVRFVK